MVLRPNICANARGGDHAAYHIGNSLRKEGSWIGLELARAIAFDVGTTEPQCLEWMRHSAPAVVVALETHNVAAVIVSVSVTRERHTSRARIRLSSLARVSTACVDLNNIQR